MSAAAKTRKHVPHARKLSRAEHSALLRRRQQAQKTAVGEPPGRTLPESEENAGAESELRPWDRAMTSSPASKPEAEAETNQAREMERVLHRGRNHVTVEQTVRYAPDAQRPVLSLTLRLTTAIRGRRRQNGLDEAAYMLRLEVLQATPGLKIEGFGLGPWQAEGLNLEPGSILVPEPIWAGFAPGIQKTRGRVVLAETQRQRVLDLPWRVTVVIPGTEPLGNS